VLPHELSFAAVDEVRARLCPTASWQSSLIGITAASSKPALVIRAEMSVKKVQQSPPGQSRLPLMPAPVGELRAVMVIANRAARKAGLSIFRNMRVPEASAIRGALNVLGTLRADEDLVMWESSTRGPLPPRRVRVFARRSGDGADALMLDRSTTSLE
jgi:hypothetical protein